MEKSLAQGKPPNAVTPLRGYLLAMAHAKLGNIAEARTWFDRAEAAKPESLPETGARAWAEAAELLGINPPAKK